MIFDNPDLIGKSVGVTGVGSSALLGHESNVEDNDSVLYRMCRMKGITCHPGQNPSYYRVLLALEQSKKRMRAVCKASHVSF
jgi:hypothetical protein